MPPDSPRLVVVGSANLDVVVPVPRHPRPGETVLGGDHALVPGGKGANQAVAASRLGAAVDFVGRIGDDTAGALLRRSLETAEVGTDHLVTDADAPSGVALITVGPDGDNAIVVSPGANARMGPADVRAAAAPLSTAGAVLLQLEVPMAVVEDAARNTAGIVLLDPAPAPVEPLPRELLERVDVLVPNETEVAVLAGVDVVPEALGDLERLARGLPSDVVVVTLGARGALVVDASGSHHVPAPEVTAVDTTAAGDAFRAALAVGIIAGMELLAAAEWAVLVGAATTLVAGAQPSLPTSDEVEERLRR